MTGQMKRKRREGERRRSRAGIAWLWLQAEVEKQGQAAGLYTAQHSTAQLNTAQHRILHSTLYESSVTKLEWRRGRARAGLPTGWPAKSEELDSAPNDTVGVTGLTGIRPAIVIEADDECERECPPIRIEGARRTRTVVRCNQKKGEKRRLEAITEHCMPQAYFAGPALQLGKE